MIALDDNFLAGVGLLGLPAEVRNDLLRHTHGILEKRVGHCLASSMSAGQLDEFESFMDAGDDEAALAWLERTCPHYQDVVREQYEGLRAELQEAAPAILEVEGVTA